MVWARSNRVPADLETNFDPAMTFLKLGISLQILAEKNQGCLSKAYTFKKFFSASCYLSLLA